MTIAPRVGGDKNSETYWVGCSNISPITRAKSFQDQRPNDLRSASIIAKKCTEGPLYKKILPWTNTRSRSILRVVSPGLSHTWNIMEWTLSYYHLYLSELCHLRHQSP